MGIDLFKAFGIAMMSTFAVFVSIFLGAKVDDVGTRIIAIISLLLACGFVLIFLWKMKNVLETTSIQSVRDLIDFAKRILFARGN